MSESIAQSAEPSGESMVSGYMHRAYVDSLAEFGTPQFLPRSGAWILERLIPGSICRDAMGCYPIFVCQDWSQLNVDLEDIKGRLVCLSAVTDPLGEYDEADLHRCFRDVVIPFKQHFVVNLDLPVNTFVHPHHRRYARKALREVHVERCGDPSSSLDEWTTLYETLTERHHITGLTAFSKASFAKQLSVPGIVAFRATNAGATIGMLLWYVQGDKAYYHLGAHSARGYELHASFALFSYALEYFAQYGLRCLDLGGGAGISQNGTSGLSRFKQGWANGTRMAYFCGRVFDRGRYSEIVKAKNVPPTKHFPAYRLGEFQ